jgi:DNA segregation ATPase FtsK/SpoIIIE, S-DNA-T family
MATKKTLKKQDTILTSDIKGIIIITLSILIMVSVYLPTIAGFVGLFISNFLKGLFGFGAYILPFIIMTFGFFIFLKKEEELHLKVSLSSTIFLCIISFAHIVNVDRQNMYISIGEYFVQNYRGGAAYNGGLVGALLGNFLLAIVGYVISYLLLTVAIGVCVMMLSGKQFNMYMEKKVKGTIKKVKNTFEKEHKESKGNKGNKESKENKKVKKKRLSVNKKVQKKNIEHKNHNRQIKRPSPTNAKTFIIKDGEILKTKKVKLLNEELMGIVHTEDDLNNNVEAIENIKYEYVPKYEKYEEDEEDEIKQEINKEEEIDEFILKNQPIKYGENIKIKGVEAKDNKEIQEDTQGLNEEIQKENIQKENIQEESVQEESVQEENIQEESVQEESIQEENIQEEMQSKVFTHETIDKEQLQEEVIQPLEAVKNIEIIEEVQSTSNKLEHDINEAYENLISKNNDVANNLSPQNDSEDEGKQLYLEKDETKGAGDDPRETLQNSKLYKDMIISRTKELVTVEEDIETKEQEQVESFEREIKKPKEEIEYIFPDISLLNDTPVVATEGEEAQILENSEKLELTLKSFGVEAKVIEVSKGPTVTRYELSPGHGVKVSKIANLADDLALNLSASGIRIEAPIPGKPAVGIEIPNKEVTPVFLREVLNDESFKHFPSNLAFGIGKDIAGNTVVADIAKMPHMLIAGATGSGKSVCINTLIVSIIYKSSPKDVKLLMIDPKVVELSIYNGIPHLLIPVVTDPKKAAGALNWAVKEMISRYNFFAENFVRDLSGYNEMLEEKGEETLPQIVIIIDELADLMMAAPGEVEDSICRLAQMARAAGIHLIIATQRPSVDVITGLIKANIPSRLAFSVSSGTDSRTILDMIGAEKLLGKGDMLFSPVGMNKPQRIQGAFISDKEVESIVKFVKDGREHSYDKEMIEKITATKNAASVGGDSDEIFMEAAEFVIQKEKASASMLQRQFRIGYNRAARLVEDLEIRGIVGAEEGSKPRKVLMTQEELEEWKQNKE